MRAVLTVVGTVVGAYFGNPALGAAIGGLVGGALEPKRQFQGPRLQDLKMGTSEYGAPIPWVEGHPRLAGIVIWGSEKRELEESVDTGGGKGGGGAEVTNYTYEIDLLYLLSGNNLVKGVRRIWSNGELVWSNADDSDLGTIIISDSALKWEEMIFYDGNEDQLPDPTYEAAVGAGEAPAYRDRATVMLRGVKLGNSGQLPNLTFEVVPEPTNDIQRLHINNHIGVEFDDPAIISVDGEVRVVTHEPHGSGSVYVFDLEDGDYARTEPRGFTTPFPGIGTDGSFPVGMLSGVAVRAQNIDSPIGDEIILTLGPIDNVVGSGLVDSLTEPLPAGEYVRGCALSSDGHALIVTSPILSVGQVIDKWYLVSYDGVQTKTLVSQGTIDPPGTPFGFGFGNAGLAPISPYSSCMLNKSHTQVWATLGSGNRTLKIWEIGDDDNLTIIYDFYEGLILIDDDPPPSAQATSIYVEESTAVAIIDDKMTFWGRNTAREGVPLDDVYTRQCLRAGLTEDQIDVSDLSGLYLRAMAISQVTSVRQTLDMLGMAYQIEATESNQIKFVRRGADPVAVIPYDDMGATEGDFVEPLPIRRTNDVEAPAQVGIRYMNVDDDYQDGVEYSDRLITSGNGVDIRELPIGLTPQETKRIADIIAMDIAASLRSVGPVSLTRAYSRLEPTDPVLLTDFDGSEYRVRLTRLNNEGGVPSFDGVFEDAAVLNSEAETTETGYTNSTTIRVIASTVMVLLDIPIIRDADDSAGIYVAGRGTNSHWPGAVVYGSSNGADYTEVTRLNTSSTLGFCTTTLGGWDGGNVFDMSSSVTVDVGSDYSLSSSTVEDVLASSLTNLCIVGDEILQFVTATFVSTGVYTLTGLLRGRKGTEWAQDDHAADEQFVLLTVAGLKRIPIEAAATGTLKYFKAVTIGGVVDRAPAQTITIEQAGLKPYSPVHLNAAHVADSGIEVSWVRRSRIGGAWVNGSDVPLGEASELYSVDVLDGSTVVRTISTTTPSTTYTAAMQAADGFAIGEDIDFNVYQVSDTVGRGFVASTQITSDYTAVPQITEITLSGTAIDGATVYATLAGVRYEYLLTGGDSLSDAAFELAAVIDAAAAYSASSVGPVVTVTGGVGVAYSVSVGADAGSAAAISSTLTQAATAARAGNKAVVFYRWQGTPSESAWAPAIPANFYLVVRKVGAGYGDPDEYGMLAKVSLLTHRSDEQRYVNDGLLNSSYGVPGDTPLSATPDFTTAGLEAHTRPAAYPYTPPSGWADDFDSSNTVIRLCNHAIVFPIGERVIVKYDPYGPSTANYGDWEVYSYIPFESTGTVALNIIASPSQLTSIPFDLPQISRVTITGEVEAGNEFTVTLGGVDYDYTALGGDDATDVAAALTTALSADTDYDITDASSGTTGAIDIERVTANVAFTISTSSVVPLTGISSSITQEAA